MPAMLNDTTYQECFALIVGANAHFRASQPYPKGTRLMAYGKAWVRRLNRETTDCKCSIYDPASEAMLALTGRLATVILANRTKGVTA
jgi:hypothetical protein